MADAWLRAVARCVAWLPVRWLAALGAAVGWLCGRVLRVRRRHVVGAMRAAGLPDPEGTADGMYRSLGHSLFEFLWLAGASAERREDLLDGFTVDPASRSVIDGARRRGRGVVLAGAHTGNWELSAMALARALGPEVEPDGRAQGEDAQVLVVAKPLHVGAFDAFARRARARGRVQLTPPEGAIAAASRALGRGGAVTMLLDQVPSDASHGVLGEFLGRPASVPRAPAAMAWRTGAPMLVVGARRCGSGRHALSVLRALVPPEGAGRAWIDEASLEATRTLEAFVRAHPTQWMWLHRRWRMPPSPGPRRLSSAHAAGTPPAPCKGTLSSSRAARSTVASSSAPASTAT